MGNREKAQIWIMDCVGKGFNTVETFDVLTTAGYTYRRRDYLKDFRELAKIPEKADRLKYASPDKSIDPSNITKVAWNLSTKYRVHYTAVVYDKETGEAWGRDISLSSDEKKTLEEWEADIRSKYIVNPSDPDVELGEVQLMDVMQRTL